MPENPNCMSQAPFAKNGSTRPAPGVTTLPGSFFRRGAGIGEVPSRFWSRDCVDS